MTPRSGPGSGETFGEIAGATSPSLRIALLAFSALEVGTRVLLLGTDPFCQRLAFLRLFLHRQLLVAGSWEFFTYTLPSRLRR